MKTDALVACEKRKNFNEAAHPLGLSSIVAGFSFRFLYTAELQWLDCCIVVALLFYVHGKHTFASN